MGKSIIENYLPLESDGASVGNKNLVAELVSDSQGQSFSVEKVILKIEEILFQQVWNVFKKHLKHIFPPKGKEKSELCIMELFLSETQFKSFFILFWFYRDRGSM